MRKLVLVALLLLLPVRAGATVLFFSGFETGDFSEWVQSQGGQTSVQTTTVNSFSNYAMQATGASPASMRGTNYANNPTTYRRFYVNLSSMSASIAARQLVIWAGKPTTNFNGSTTAELYVTTDGSGNPTLNLINRVTAVVVGSSAVSAGAWHLVEIKIVVSATVGIMELKIDGVVVATASNVNTGSSGLQSDYLMYFNAVGTGTPSGTVDFDDYQLNNSGYAGTGYVIARQSNTTAPNYNAWTKTGGVNIWNVWDNTPTTTGTFASDATAADNQTGVPDFTITGGTGSTGHGTGTVGVSDTINAAKISLFGKTASTTADGADSTIFRTPAGGGGSDTITALSVYTTSAAYKENILATPTTAQVRNCEIGVQKGTGTNLHTVNDTWFQIDWTPQTVPTPTPTATATATQTPTATPTAFRQFHGDGLTWWGMLFPAAPERLLEPAWMVTPHPKWTGEG